MKFFFTKDKIWLAKWDEFLQQENRSSHLLYSDWLASYKSYGFDFEVFIIEKNQKIIGGFGAVIAKSSLFKFYSIPHGPILEKEFEDELDTILNTIKQRAKELKCCYVQYSLPVSNISEIQKQTYSSESITALKNLGKKGNLFKYVYSSYGINWIDFNTTNLPDELLLQFSVQVRRNINLAYKNNAVIEYATTESDCRTAYFLIEENARVAGYAVRSFDDFKDTILNLISKEMAFFITASVDGEIKGSAFFVRCGNNLTYISGGTKKEKPDLKIGYLLHWEIIKKAYQLGYRGYNISMGGSKGVVEFKSKFNTKSILFDSPHYHVVLRPILFKVYLILNSIFVKNKKTVSILLKRFK